MTPTPTGTVTADSGAQHVTLTFALTHADFLALLAGLAWVDILGGFGAWRTILPLGDQPARLAGQFNLRKTYDQQPTVAALYGAGRDFIAPNDTTQPGGAPETPAGTRADPAGARPAGQQAGCGCGGAERDGAGAGVLSNWPPDPLPVPMAEPASGGATEVIPLVVWPWEDHFGAHGPARDLDTLAEALNKHERERRDA